MSGEEIIIEISADGRGVTVEAKNVPGPDCVKLTAEIENAVGRRTNQRKTAEYHKTPPLKRKAGA